LTAKYSLFVLLLLAFVPMVQLVNGSPDGTTTITLNPVADQVVGLLSFGPLLPGTSGIHCRADITRVYRSYLKFDLSGISDPDMIIGAELRLYCDASTVPPATLDVNVHETGDLLIDGTAPWTEAELVWSNAPDLGELIATTAVGDKGSWYGWDGSDMIDYVKVECAGDDIISFAMKLAVENTSISIIPYHRDFSDRLKPNAPQLIITLVSPMIISGHKFNDLDGDGTWDNGEPALEGWTINLEGSLFKTTTSDSAGYFEFADLAPGTYTISEALQDGWIQTEPTPPGTYSVSLMSCSVTDRDFGNFEEATVTVYKYEDADGDLATADDWTPIDWPVTLKSGSGDITGSTGTAGKAFSGLGPGLVTVTEADDPEWAHLNSSSWSRALESGGTYEVKFVNFKLVTIAADKFDDIDGDGVRDSGEPAIPGWALTITYPDGTTDTMDSPASWTVERGGTYTITEEPRDGWAHTTDDSVDVAVKSGSVHDTVWFGNFKLVTIRADKWNDFDGDGVRDKEEPDIPMWKLTLHYPDGTTDTMDSPASWVVKQGGKYTITEAEKSGWAHTTASSVDLVVKSGDNPSMVWFGNRQEGYRNIAKGWLSDTSEQRIEVTDFNIVFTPSKGSYKISSTNPGGFYFNVLYQTGADPTTISYALANNGNGDFVTKGSMPVHAYIWNDLDKDGKIDYWGELTDVTNKITTAQEPDLAKGTIKVKGVPIGTNVLITIHITFALKGTSGYDLNQARAFEGKRYTFTADGGFSVKATLTAHVKI